MIKISNASKRMKLYTIVTLVALFFSSCVVSHQGSISGTYSQKPLTCVDQVSGTSSIQRFLGMGGVTQAALIRDARNNMMSYRPLVEGEQYGNYIVDIKSSNFFVFQKILVTVTADILSENDKRIKLDSGAHTDLTPLKKDTRYFFTVGDTVLLSNYEKVVIEKFKQKEKVQVRFVTNNYKRIKTVSIEKIFSYRVPHKEFIPGKRYPYPVSYGVMVLDETLLVGIGIKKAMIYDPRYGRITCKLPVPEVEVKAYE